MQDNYTPKIDLSSRWSIITIYSLIVLLPLLIAIISFLSQIINHISPEAALHSSADSEIIDSVIQQNSLNPNTTTVHQIAKDGNWVAVTIASTSPNDLGNSAVAILKKQDSAYQTIYIGTGFDEKTLTSLGVPSGLASNLVSNDRPSQYDKALKNSYLNTKERYPLLKELPVHGDRMSITYYYEEDHKDSEGIDIPIIKISGTNAAERSNALNKIRNFGYDPGDYRIVFAGLSNPFTDEVIIKETTPEKERQQAP